LRSSQALRQAAEEGGIPTRPLVHQQVRFKGSSGSSVARYPLQPLPPRRSEPQRMQCLPPTTHAAAPIWAEHVLQRKLCLTQPDAGAGSSDGSGEILGLKGARAGAEAALAGRYRYPEPVYHVVRGYPELQTQEAPAPSSRILPSQERYRGVWCARAFFG
jgi:hypothetical protein